MLEKMAAAKLRVTAEYIISSIFRDAWRLPRSKEVSIETITGKRFDRF